MIFFLVKVRQYPDPYQNETDPQHWLDGNLHVTHVRRKKSITREKFRFVTTLSYYYMTETDQNNKNCSLLCAPISELSSNIDRMTSLENIYLADWPENTAGVEHGWVAAGKIVI